MLAQEICQRLVEQLNYIHFQPKVILDLGAASGYANKFLRKLYPQARILSLDVAEKLLQLNTEQSICAVAQSLPLSAHGVDLVFSNLMLPWCEDLAAVFSEVYRVLTPGGLFLFSSFGAETLQEIYHSWQAVDTYPHVHSCYDLQDIGDLLLQQQFVDPVMNSEKLQINYRDIQQLSRELKQAGMQNILDDRRSSLTGKHRWQQFLQQLNQYYNSENRLAISFEIIYGHGWRGELSKNNLGEVTIPVSAIKRV